MVGSLRRILNGRRGKMCVVHQIYRQFWRVLFGMLDVGLKWTKSWRTCKLVFPYEEAALCFKSLKA